MTRQEGGDSDRARGRAEEQMVWREEEAARGQEGRMDRKEGWTGRKDGQEGRMDRKDGWTGRRDGQEGGMDRKDGWTGRTDGQDGQEGGIVSFVWQLK